MLRQSGGFIFSLRIEMQSLILSTTFNDFKEKVIFKRRGKETNQILFSVSQNISIKEFDFSFEGIQTRSKVVILWT